jgi:hypothetical protein
LNHKNIAEEVYKNNELVGWKITNIGWLMYYNCV